MSPPLTTRRDVARGAARLGLLSLPVVADPGAIGRASAVAGDALQGNPWFVASEAGLLYVVVPLVTLSACALVLAPGLLLVAQRGRTVPDWLFRGFALSLGVVSVASGLAQAAFGAPLGGRAYALFLVALGALAASIAWWRAPVHRTHEPSPIGRSGTTLELVMLIGGAVVAYYALSPKLLFESFNGDGAHAFESSRLLVRHALPFWPEGAGPVAGFPGVTSMLFAFPNAWFLRLFGEVEFAARAAFLLYLPVVGAGLLTLARAGRGEARFHGVTLITVGAGVACYTVAMAFSATYSPYSADIALPATQDTLLMIAYLGVAIASLRREYGWSAWFVLLTFLSLPSGLILIGFWMLARLVVERPRPWAQVVVMGVMLIGCLALSALLPRLLEAAGAPAPGREYGLAGLLRYFAFLQFTDISRLLYVLLPAGIFPWLVLPAWRAQDALGRTLTLVTLAYFAFFFVQAHVSLHHFVPAMLLPLVVAARVADDKPLLGVTWVTLATLAFILVLPQRATIHGVGRVVGNSIVERVGDYASSDPAVMRASTLLDQVFPYDWDPAVPALAYGGSPLVWNHYARHRAPADDKTNYILQPAVDEVPAGWRLLAHDSAGAALIMRSDSVLAAQRALRPPTPAGSRWLAVPRRTLFRSVAQHEGHRSISVVDLLERAGVDVNDLLDRLGVERPDRP